MHLTESLGRWYIQKPQCYELLNRSEALTHKTQHFVSTDPMCIHQTSFVSRRVNDVTQYDIINTPVFCLATFHTSPQVVPNLVRCRTALWELPRTVLSDLPRTVLSELPNPASLTSLPVLMTKGARFSLFQVRKENLSRKPWSEDVTSTDLYTETSMALKRRLKGTTGEKWFHLAHAIDLKQALLKRPSLSREISWLMVGSMYKNTRNTKKDKSNLDFRRSLRSKKRTL